VFIVLMGVGGFMMFSAYKNSGTGPWQEFLNVLNGTSASTPATQSGPLNSSLDAGTLTFPSYAPAG
jgi:hypothetical protein